MKRKHPLRAKTADVKAAADRAEKTAKGETPATAKVEIDPVVVQADEIKSKMGRPTKYKPEYARIALALCRRGATDFELAEELDVNTSTIWRWSCVHEDFCNALRVGKDSFDDRVERSLAQRASGYSYHTQKVFQFQGEVVRAHVVEHVPPDVNAAKYWLGNRRPEKWRDVHKHEHGPAGAFSTMTDAELEAYIANEAAALIMVAEQDMDDPSTRH